MAVDANRTFAGRTASRRREIRDRVALVVAVLLVIAGGVAYFQMRADQPSKTAASPIQHEQQTPSAPVVKSGGKLDPVAKGVAVRFIRSALGRQQLHTSWNLATPELRSAVTRKQWLNGELPFPPFPVKRGLQTTGFHVVGTSPIQVLLEVLLIPELDSGYVPTRFELTLDRKNTHAPWRVSYFLPYAPPGMYTEPQ